MQGGHLNHSPTPDETWVIIYVEVYTQRHTQRYAINTSLLIGNLLPTKKVPTIIECHLPAPIFLATLASTIERHGGSTYATAFK